MKITTLFPDNLRGISKYAKSIKLAITDWVYKKRIERLNHKLSKTPVEFKKGFDVLKIRDKNNRHS